MNQNSSFKIFNASAGSGKTFNLVKSYLKLLFTTINILSFRHVLALTFTNKAVEEMKNRVIESLQQFSKNEILIKPTELFSQLKVDLNLTSEELHLRSKTILKQILHNYASFDISTIDKFNHRIIRTFSKDLKLPTNFEVELDTASILNKAVDRLLDKAGKEKDLTNLLIGFAMDKIEDDRSWDISYDLNEIAQILIRENDRVYLESIEDKTLDDFKKLKSFLIEKNKALEYQIINKAKEVLGLIYDQGLTDGDFYRSTLPNHFKKLISLKLDGIYGNQLEQSLSENTGLYTKSTNLSVKDKIDNLCPHIYSSYIEIKSLVAHLLLHKNALQNLSPLSLLSEINKCLTDILAEEQIVLISDFNSLINEEIKNQPAPYIYERLGERYRYFFIDEFQDTSVVQWTNLIPLIDNSLSQLDLFGHGGSALIVGDAKQAIYRWRGGNADQFIGLYEQTKNPFNIEAELIMLQENYRSNATIVNFNNDFFNHITPLILSDQSHKNLYSSSAQKVTINEKGYVELSFIDPIEEDKDLLYGQKCLEIIESSSKRGFTYSDICILTRTTKDNISIAEYLNQAEVPIISSESLLLRNSTKVSFIINVLEFLINPEDKNFKIKILEFLYRQGYSKADEHQFYEGLLRLNTSEFMEAISGLAHNFNFSDLLILPLYEVVEHIIRGFDLNTSSDSYIVFLLDEVFAFSQNNHSSVAEFLAYWHLKSEKLSIISPKDSDAVQLMTIHKAKGLEFPIVIFPYANQEVYRDKKPKIWYSVNPDEYEGFEFLYLNMNQNLSLDSEIGSQLYEDHRSQLELDNLNLLYVVLTRPSKELYIVSEKELNKKGEHNLNKFSGLFIDYLRFKGTWQVDTFLFTFGEPTDYFSAEKIHTSEDYFPLYSSNRRSLNLNVLAKSGLLWDTAQAAAIERGNLIHNVLSYIETASDLPKAIKMLIEKGEIEEHMQKDIIKVIMDIINNPKIKEFFTDHWTIYNERDILTPEGEAYRPDRLVINDQGEAVILDYKTGIYSEMHQGQLEIYSELIESMRYRVKSKILIYIDDQIDIKEF